MFYKNGKNQREQKNKKIYHLFSLYTFAYILAVLLLKSFSWGLNGSLSICSKLSRKRAIISCFIHHRLKLRNQLIPSRIEGGGEF